MTPITATALRLVDGRTLALGHLTQVEVTSSLSSPAQSARVVCAVDAFPGELGQVTVRRGPLTLFTGRVDKQVSSLSPSGRLLTLEARSKGGLLLDNEAVPCVLTGVRLTTVFQQFVQPYGFLLYLPAAGGSLPVYTVGKGQCEWDAFAGFARRVYGFTPYIVGDQVMAQRPRYDAPLVIGGAALPFTKLEHVSAPYHMLSKVILRDVDGYYSSSVSNSNAPYYGVQRKRYIIPANEFVDAPGLDANQRIRRSMLQKDRVVVTAPGFHPADIGMEAQVADDAFTMSNLLVDELTYRQDGSGLTTTFALVSSIYYD